MHIQHRIRSFIIDTGRWHRSAGELASEYPLIDEEVLDSMGIFELVSFLEDEFGVVVDDDDLVIENFLSIHAIGSMIASKVAV